jgi:ActR/RegA family two-component response regulator
MPLLFITGHPDVPMTVQAIKARAVEFLTKPVKEDVLLAPSVAPSSTVVRHCAIAASISEGLETQKGFEEDWVLMCGLGWPHRGVRGDFQPGCGTRR